ncbi:molecular chaperone HscC [Bradyrhizobium macuxiense]|uniref:Molecular chaperone HscC n=1 Tax=Bradyrhizobium macuxiense TaxID=1755647 RepID=A0A560LM36_9BRAD|nr:molecular chaperone HscC [Bradyrhizobium macuxiense]TWB96292.1 molecular chaperone HscC [Bradyrhizobium macuxiense]
MIIGIDLGTTNSLVGVWKAAAAELIPNALGSLLTPSAVSVDDDGAILVGLPARERLLSHPRQSAASFKRYMGSNRSFQLGARTFRAEELSALVLQSLKADAEAFLGQPVSEAIITVPAYFNDAQRKATKAAGEMAGLKVERLLNEPTAAALAYGLQEGVGDRKILVLDLGGGTFDVSILEMFEGVMEVRASAGDNFLGGEDFVDVIVDRFMAEAGVSAGIPPRSASKELHANLRRQAEIAKRALTDHEQHEIELVHGGVVTRWSITRNDFETASEPLLRRLRAPIERAIRDADLNPDQVTDLVLVGGATRMPVVRRMAARLFQRLPIAQISPDEVVARGAAVQAGLKMRDVALDDVVMTDVAPYSLGINTRSRLADNSFLDGLYLPIIERNTVIPVSRSKQVSTAADGQREVRFRIFQGEARMVADNIEIGQLSVPVPPGPAGKERIDVRFTYDVSGLLEVDLLVVSTGQTVQLVIEGNPGILSQQEIDERLAGLRGLKIHPRDQAENQAVIARAERLYEERLGDERTAIGKLIDDFRILLERQLPSEIENYRTRFSEWLDRVDTTVFS